MTSSYMAEMRLRSGSVNSDDPLVDFLYILLRDHLPAGTVEEIMLNHVNKEESQYTNGWLANYALDIATRLKGHLPTRAVPPDISTLRP